MFDVLNHGNAGREVKGHNCVGIFFYFEAEKESSGDRLCRVLQRWRVVSGTKSLETI